MIGAGVASMVSTLLGVRANSVGVGGLPGFLAIRAQDIPSFLLVMAIAIVVPVTLTLAFKKAGILSKAGEPEFSETVLEEEITTVPTAD
jgi:PTS system trehalose-specific IIC component